SAPGSSLLASCVCQPGSTGDDGGPCEPCAKGFYKAGAGGGACESCPGNATSKTGASLLAECLCLEGYAGETDGGECATCPAGTFKVGNGTGVCMACPAGTYSPYAAAQSNLSCVECVAGTFAKSPASPACKTCPGMSISGAGAAACSNAVAAIQASAVVAGNLTAFLAMEEGYLASYAAAAGLHPSLVSTLTMEEIEVEVPDGLRRGFEVPTGLRRGFVYQTSVRHTFFLRCSTTSLASIMSSFLSGGFAALLSAILQARGYPACTVEDPQTLCGSGKCPGADAMQDLCLECPFGTYKMLPVPTPKP
ncbi:hypothetical protein T484DRAFT_1804969, partial [Baffinella frigidus]